MTRLTGKDNQKVNKKLKKFGYLFLALVGFILIVIAILLSLGAVQAGVQDSSAKQNVLYAHFYNILMGIGCGLVATGAGTMFITNLLSDITEKKENLDEWGIEGVYLNRPSLKEIDLPKRQLDIAAFGVPYFCNNISVPAIEARVKEGLEIRLLIPNPNSEFIAEQQKQGEDKNLSSEIRELIQWADKIKTNTQNATTGYLKYQVYNSLPIGYYCRADNIIDVGSYIPGHKSANTITYRYYVGEKGGSYYAETFEAMWLGTINIGFTERYGDWFAFDQKKAVESCLGYFASILQKGIGPKVVGIVAIFKDEMRRTFYSCNKDDGREKHKSHGIEKGTIGFLRLKNVHEKLGKVYVFCDYEHGIEYEYANLRNKTITVSTIKHRKLDNNEECVAILAAPLVRSDGQFIGAVTFDFADFPERYKSSCALEDLQYDTPYDISSLKNIENERLHYTLSYVRSLLQTLISACDLTLTMLGQYGVSDYKGLYEEEWNNDDQL